MSTHNHQESMRQRVHKARNIREELVALALRVVSNYALASK